MAEKNARIVYSSSLDQLTKFNSSFDKGVLRVAYTDRNRNGSSISKDVFERCMPSIFNCPVVCSYDRSVDEFGAHDVEIYQDDEGHMRMVNITHPVGVVPTGSNYWWDTIVEDDGSTHEYLFVEVLIWKRQEAYQKIKEDGVVAESMEISIKEGSMKDGVYVIERFEFTAFCLLGTAEPCYESASLVVFSQEDFKAQFNEMMQDFKESFSLVQPPQGAEINPTNFSEGGKETLDEKKILMAQYGLTEDMLDFNLDDFSEDELPAKFEALVASNKEKSFALAEQFREELMGALSTETVETCFGQMSRYWYTDYDAEAMEVYCYDYEDWKLYGFTYSMNGDHVEVNFDSKKRKKFSIVDFDEGEQTASFAAVFSIVAAQHEAVTKEWSDKYELVSGQVSTLEAELDTLRKFKSDIEESADMQAREDVFTQFEDLTGVEAFDNLRENCLQYSLEDLEEKCFAIRGRTQAGKFSIAEPKAPKLPIEKTGAAGAAADKEPYGGVFTEFGIAPKQK